MTAIEVQGLTKRFGAVPAVRDLSFVVRPGRVTGFLGPNGAGKTTTLRALLGLVRPTSGSGTFDGVPYAALDEPARTVGAVLEGGGFHPGRRARDHLRLLATAARLPTSRVDVALQEVGLSGAARRRVGGFSLGMRQRLALGAALLGDPPVLVLDEPSNGLDPDGIRWLRELLRARAGQGGTVLVSSHVLSEVEQTVDDVVVVREGQLVAQGPLVDLLARRDGRILVRTPDAEALRLGLAGQGLAAEIDRDGRLHVPGATVEQVGQIASSVGAELHELRAVGGLEDLFRDLTATDGAS